MYLFFIHIYEICKQVQFEGDMLMQGTSDNVAITVLTETVQDTKSYKSGMSNEPHAHAIRTRRRTITEYVAGHFRVYVVLHIYVVFAHFALFITSNT
jgi:hypothetical protein